MANKVIPQDTLLPLLDAPLDDLATYLAGDSWEARKNYLSNMMSDSIANLVKQMEIFEQKGHLSRRQWRSPNVAWLVYL